MAYEGLLKRYQNHLTVLNYSPCSIKQYLELSRKFLDWLLKEKGIERIQDVAKEALTEYQNRIYSRPRIRDGKPLSLSMKSSAIVGLKNFFRFLNKKGEILYNPASDLEIPKQRQDVLREVLKEKEVMKILKANRGRTALEVRDRAILELFYSTGIRNTELRELCLGDIDLEKEEVQIRHGKGYFGESQRVLPVGRHAIAWIEEYLRRVRPAFRNKGQSNHLFITLSGSKLSIDKPDDIVKRYARLAGIKKKVRTHMLRHSFATHLLRHGCDIRHVQAMLGHRCLDSTKVYTRVEISDLKRVHRRTHPRERQ